MSFLICFKSWHFALMMPIANCTLSSRIVYADHFQASIFWILVELFLVYFSFLRPLCALYSPFHGRLGKADCTTPCKILFSGIKNTYFEASHIGRIFLRRTFSQFQSLSIFFLISGHYFIFCPPLRALWSMFGV